jgi:hypothetical protein
MGDRKTSALSLEDDFQETSLAIPNWCVPTLPTGTAQWLYLRYNISIKSTAPPAADCIALEGDQNKFVCASKITQGQFSGA